jgi:hypothetical protein
LLSFIGEDIIFLFYIVCSILENIRFINTNLCVIGEKNENQREYDSDYGWCNRYWLFTGGDPRESG